MFIRFASGVNSVQPNTTNIVQSRTLYSMETEVMDYGSPRLEYGSVSYPDDIKKREKEKKTP